MALMLGSLVLLAAFPASALEPAQGRFLIAHRDGGAGWFDRTVILLIQHDNTGTVGLIINRPTDIPPAEVLPDIAELRGYPGRLFAGGPVDARGVTMLIRSERAPPGAAHVFANVYASGSRDLLRTLARQAGPNARVRLYAGYTGWSPGQLRRELLRGSWTVAPAAEHYVFSENPAQVWSELAPAARTIITWLGSHALGRTAWVTRPGPGDDRG